MAVGPATRRWCRKKPLAATMTCMSDGSQRRKLSMGVVLLIVAMVAVIVGADLLFFRSGRWTWERLAANVGIVLVFGAFYFRYLARS